MPGPGPMSDLATSDLVTTAIAAPIIATMTAAPIIVLIVIGSVIGTMPGPGRLIGHAKPGETNWGSSHRHQNGQRCNGERRLLYEGHRLFSLFSAGSEAATIRFERRTSGARGLFHRSGEVANS